MKIHLIAKDIIISELLYNILIFLDETAVVFRDIEDFINNADNTTDLFFIDTELTAAVVDNIINNISQKNNYQTPKFFLLTNDFDEDFLKFIDNKNVISVIAKPFNINQISTILNIYKEMRHLCPCRLKWLEFDKDLRLQLESQKNKEDLEKCFNNEYITCEKFSVECIKTLKDYYLKNKIQF